MTPPRSLHIRVYCPWPTASLRTSLVSVRLRKDSASGPETSDLAHVRNIEKARRLPHCQVLVHDAGVLHRHFPAAEFDEFSAQFLVGGKKRSPFHFAGSISRAKA